MAFTLDPKLAGFLGSTLQDVGYGLSNAPTFATGLGRSVERGQERAPERSAYAIEEKAAADKQAAMQAQTELRAKYSSFFSQQGENDYARAVADGIIEPGDAYRDWMTKKAGGGGPAPTTDMQNYEYGQQNPGFNDWRTQKGAQPPPSGYQWTPEGQLGFIPGGPNDPKNKPQGQMSATMQKELFEADETVVAGKGVTQALDTALDLNKTAWDGPFAEQRAYAGALAGNQDAATTLELKNIVTQQALEQLKLIFGAMPTEGERKILLEIQGSVDQPRGVREAIYTRAKALAVRRIAANQQKGEALRNGTYFEEGFSPVPAAPGGDIDSLVNKYLTGP